MSDSESDYAEPELCIEEESCAVFYRVYERLCSKISLNICDVNDYILNNRETIFNKTNEKKKTMLQLSYGKNKKVFEKIYYHPRITYKCLANKYDDNDILKKILNDDFDYFTELYSKINKQGEIRDYFYNTEYKFLRYVLATGNMNKIKKFITYVYHLGSLNVEWKECPERYENYSFMSFLIENKDRKIYDSINGEEQEIKYVVLFEDIIKYLNKNDYKSVRNNDKKNKGLKYLIEHALLKRKYNIVLSLYLYTIDNSIKNHIIEIIYEYFRNEKPVKCLTNLICDTIIDNKNLIKSIDRLSYIIKNGDKIQIQRLVTSKNFTKEEYEYINEETGNNCIMDCMKYNKDMLDCITMNDYFLPEMVKHKNKENYDVKYFIKKYCNDNKIAWNLYKMIFNEPEIVIEGEEDSKMTCKICCENRINISFIPCGHTQCSNCIANTTKKCPFCNKQIEDFHQVLFS